MRRLNDMCGIALRPIRELRCRRRQGQRRIGRDQLFEVGQRPGSQRRQSQHHAHHTQRGHDRGTHTRLPGSYSVDRRRADRSNDQSKAQTRRYRADCNLVPVDVNRPAAHQVEACRGKEQAQDSGETAGNTAAKPAAKQRSDRYHRGETKQRQPTIKHRSLQYRIDKDRNIGHSNDQRCTDQQAHK